MLPGARVAAFALYARHHAAQLKPAVNDRASGMTAEARTRLEIGKLAPERFQQRARLNAGIADRDIQPLDRVIVAHQALVQAAVVFKHPGLRTAAEGPADRKRQRALAIADGVSALRATGLD